MPSLDRADLRILTALSSLPDTTTVAMAELVPWRTVPLLRSLPDPSTPAA